MVALGRIFADFYVKQTTLMASCNPANTLKIAQRIYTIQCDPIY